MQPTVLAGLAVAPFFSCQLSLVGALAPAGAATEAFTWHRTATIAGMAAGSMIGGALIGGYGAGGAFAVGCAGVLLASVLTAFQQARIDPEANSLARRPAVADNGRPTAEPASE